MLQSATILLGGFLLGACGGFVVGDSPVVKRFLTCPSLSTIQSENKIKYSTQKKYPKHPNLL